MHDEKIEKPWFHAPIISKYKSVVYFILFYSIHFHRSIVSILWDRIMRHDRKMALLSLFCESWFPFIWKRD